MHGLGTLGLGGFAPHSEAPLLPGEGGGAKRSGAGGGGGLSTLANLGRPTGW